MASEAQKRAQKKYDAAHSYMVTLKLNRKTDAELIEALEGAESKQGLIREALRAWVRGENMGT